MARCLLIESNLPQNWWTYAVQYSVYVRNRCFDNRLGITPYEAVMGTKPNLKKMHVFGQTCYAYVDDRKKLDPRSRKGIFLGCDKNSPAYIVYFPGNLQISKIRCFSFSKMKPVSLYQKYMTLVIVKLSKMKEVLHKTTKQMPAKKLELMNSDALIGKKVA